jgi:GNAT superfamily N-acetyltransferase
MEKPMKRNLLKMIAIAGYLVATTSAHAMLKFIPESVPTKSGKILQLRAADTQEESDLAMELIKSRLENAGSGGSEYQEICAYLTTPTGPTLVGAANFLIEVPGRPYLYLSNMVVDEKFQGQGIGAALLTYLLRNTNSTIRLYSLGNLATSFYGKHGFFSYDKHTPGKMERHYPPTPPPTN